MWLEIGLVAVIIILLAYIIISRGSASKQRGLKQELDARREELRMLRQANKTSYNKLSVDEDELTISREELFQLVRDLEGLRSAIAGSRVSRKMLTDRYNLEPGRKLFDQIMKAGRHIDPKLKNRLADEILVGESGRVMMKSLDAGASVEEAANRVGMPLVVAKGQITRLRILEYVDSSLKTTKRGKRALV